MVCLDAPRPRNANATRTAILEAALERFAADSYDDVGMRDIARDVGVDAALISRYFGSKEDLFTAVMESCDTGGDLMSGDRAGWGLRVANELIYEQKTAGKFKGLLILLRSIGSAKATEIVQRGAQERFYGPFAQWVGGEDGMVRARLASSLLMGLKISKEVTGGFGLTDAQCEQLRDRLAATLQSFIDD